MAVLEEEEREKGTKEIFEMIMTKNVAKLMSELKSLIQGSQRTPAR